jgi:hypothetical protein
MSRTDHSGSTLARCADQRLRLQANLENLINHASAAYGSLGAAVPMRKRDAAGRTGAASCPGDRALFPPLYFHDHLP